MADRAAFIVQFPEFTNTATGLVTAMLAAAALEVDADVWGAKADQGQMYLAAHKLALSATGNAARMVLTKPADTPHGTTPYGIHFDSLVLQVASGFRVVA